MNFVTHAHYLLAAIGGGNCPGIRIVRLQYKCCAAGAKIFVSRLHNTDFLNQNHQEYTCKGRLIVGRKVLYLRRRRENFRFEVSEL